MWSHVRNPDDEGEGTTSHELATVRSFLLERIITYWLAEMSLGTLPNSEVAITKPTGRKPRDTPVERLIALGKVKVRDTILTSQL